MKKNIPTFITSVVLFVAGVLSAHAEIALDKTVPQKKALSAIKPMQKEIIWPYAQERTFVFRKDTTIPYRPNLASGEERKSVFAWRMNQKQYYSYVLAYVPDNDLIKGCENYPPSGSRINWEGPDCDWINSRHLVCHLFMMTEQGQIAGIGRLQIGRDERLIKGKPFCYEVKSMSAPKEIENSMLMTVKYIDSAAPADPRNLPEEFPMTVLMRFKQEPDGKLNITQDDRCLPNPNRIANIAQAHKVLKANRCMK
jgi:hypothetical protein